MAWGKYKEGSGSGARKDWVSEGNLDLFVFSQEPTRCRFLTEDVSAEDVMAEMKCTREEAEDHLYTKVSQDRWVLPRAYWEHQIKEIPGVRFFATAACGGRGRCPLCDENDRAKENGVSENKLLPYPVRKRFLVPAFFYALNRVLFVRAADDFFDTVADYVNKNGSGCDFDIYKTGRGFDTKYKAVFVGASSGPAPSVSIAPRDVQIVPDEAELNRRLAGGKRPDPEQRPAAASQQQAAPEAVTAAAEVATPSDSFKIPFGTHKGKTFEDLAAAGEGAYIKLLAENGMGIVQRKARDFLGMA